MDDLAVKACDGYRDWVREHPHFVTYFRQATPEPELASLPLGSRPARRRQNGGIETLRAIPWIFAWSQNRLVLQQPALVQRKDLDSPEGQQIRKCAQWPFCHAYPCWIWCTNPVR